MPRSPRIAPWTVVVLLLAASARAQLGQPAAQPPARPASQAPAQPSIGADTISDTREATNQQKDWHFVGHVEFPIDKDTTIFADDLKYTSDDDMAIVTGNVTFAQGSNRISAERAEFNTKESLGTFYNATGIVTVKPPSRPQPVRPGAVAPPAVPGQETSVIFFGEKIEKIGRKKYRITNGGFSTCTQPTPRWDLHAGTVVLNVGHYTMLRQAVLTVKGVPMLYLPVIAYPTKKEDRATGFLIPAYGVTTLRGQSIHDAFFWAIDRSQDATIMHDWFSKVGQGIGGEYRYNYGLTGNGFLNAYMLNQHEATYVQADGTETTTDANRYFQLRGTTSETLPGNIRVRGNLNYFSSISTSQTFNTNIFDATSNQRTIGGNVVGAWSSYTLNGTLDHNEYFYNATDSSLSGSWPKVAFSRNERQLFGSPVYFTVGTEFAHLLRNSFTSTSDIDSSLTRFDISPQIRYPFKKWQWFTVNSTVSWHDTYYTRSLDPSSGTTVDDSLSRRFYSLQAQIVGPVFNRIWDTPDNTYAEKFKHSIEPVLTVTRTSTIDNYDHIPQFDGVDSFVGGVNYTYGLNNRFYARRHLTPGAPAQAREIVDVEISQSYYTNQFQAQYDRQYQTSTYGGEAPSSFSPIALNVRIMPTIEVNATMRAEFDARYHSLRTISASGGYALGTYLQTQVGWSKRAFIAELPDFNDPTRLDQTLNASATARTKDNKYGTVYSFNYDVLHGAMLQQRVSGFYNAQCCGLAIEYQTYNYGAASLSPIPADRRFFLSFTLAGLGNFSPMNGALGGVPR
ncbi:MAG: LPS-assembly protein LptD [Acidobacteria bacterium]|nr:LPS-assembly protein LptD [Acidobacteriota bacterium]